MIETLRAIPLFQKFSDDALEALSRILGEEKRSAGEPVFREGDDGDSFYIVGEGEVEIRKQGKPCPSRRWWV